MEQMAITEPQSVMEMLTYLTTGGGAILTAGVIWFVKRQIESIDKLHDRIDELEREVLVLQTQGGMEQTMFTPRKPRRGRP